LVGSHAVTLTLPRPLVRGRAPPLYGAFFVKGHWCLRVRCGRGALLSIRVELACWGASCSRRSLVFGGSENPCHDATLRIGGEAPRWRSILSRGKRSQGRVRATPPRIRSAGCLGPAEAGSALLTRRRDEARRLPAPYRRSRSTRARSAACGRVPRSSSCARACWHSRFALGTNAPTRCPSGT